MGEVWLGHDPDLDVPVAIKLLPGSLVERDPVYVDRFIKEARTAARINHHNVVHIFAAGSDGGQHYIVMEYVGGGTLKQLMAREGVMHWKDALAVVKGVAEGLKTAARFNVIHRDIKPDNIMLDEDGTPKLADLGLAKQIDAPDDLTMTTTGLSLGTPAYIAPEQTRKSRNVDQRADIYSLGATLYNMVTGEKPFPGGTSFEVMMKHLNEPLPDPAARNPDLPASIRAIIYKMMMKDPDKRYQDAGELLHDLNGVLDHDAPVGKLLASDVEGEPAFGGRKYRKYLLPAGCAVVAACLAALVIFPRSGRDIAPPAITSPEPEIAAKPKEPEPAVIPEPLDPKPEPKVVTKSEEPEPKVVLKPKYPEPKVPAVPPESEPEPGPEPAPRPEPGPKVIAKPGKPEPSVTRKPEPKNRVKPDQPDLAAPVVMPEVPVKQSYMVVDLSGGPKSPGYPVKYLDTKPDNLKTDPGWRIRFLLLKRIPAGKFVMGTPAAETGREASGAGEARREVVLTRDFYMGVFEVTQSQWELVMDNNPSKFRGRKLPVEQVTWPEVRGGNWPGGNPGVDSFMDRLRQRTGIEFDLPTEAQWEYAARGGNVTAYSFGDDPNLLYKYGNYRDKSSELPAGENWHEKTDLGRDDGYKCTAPAGSYSANPWGLYDVHGNVMEWCLDYYGRETGTGRSVKDLEGPVSGTSRMVRGGCWIYGVNHCRSGFRLMINPGSRFDIVGFRVCSEVPSP